MSSISKMSNRRYTGKPIYKRREPIRVIPSSDMINSIESNILNKHGEAYKELKYNELSIDILCDLFTELLHTIIISDIRIDQLQSNLLQFYGLMCHPNMPSLMISRKDVVNSKINHIEMLLNRTYINPNIIKLLGNVFISELYVIGIIQLSREHRDIALRILSEEELQKISDNCSVINETSTLSTKYMPITDLNHHQKIVLNINGGHGQEQIVPSILSNTVFFNILFNNSIEIEQIDPSDASIIYTIEQIEIESLFVANLFMNASFGFVRKLLEIIYGYKAFEYFDVNTEKRGLPYDRSNNMKQYTIDTLKTSIQLKMIDVLMNPENNITINLWKKAFNIAHLLYSEIIN